MERLAAWRRVPPARRRDRLANPGRFPAVFAATAAAVGAPA